MFSASESKWQWRKEKLQVEKWWGGGGGAKLTGSFPSYPLVHGDAMSKSTRQSHSMGFYAGSNTGITLF